MTRKPFVLVFVMMGLLAVACNFAAPTAMFDGGDDGVVPTPAVAVIQASGPEDVVAQYLNAIFDGDIDQLKDLTCSEYDSIYDDTAFAESLATMASLMNEIEDFEITFDLDYDVDYDGDTATIRVVGGSMTMKGSFAGQEINETQDVDQLGVNDEPLIMRREAGNWTVCDPTMAESMIGG